MDYTILGSSSTLATSTLNTSMMLSDQVTKVAEDGMENFVKVAEDGMENFVKVAEDAMENFAKVAEE